MTCRCPRRPAAAEGPDSGAGLRRPERVAAVALRRAHQRAHPQLVPVPVSRGRALAGI